MSFTLTATIVHVFDTKQISDTFQIREFVVRTDGEYPEEPKFQIAQDKCKLLDNLKQGDVVTLQFNLRGKRYEKKTGGADWFTSLSVWRIDTAVSSTTTKQAQEKPSSTSTIQRLMQENDNYDDVPF